MKVLPQEAFNRAQTFVQTHARELDQRLFEHFFAGGSQEAVYKSLGRYQNEDGGFGQAIEPDFRYPGSSPMATTVGLGILRDLEAPAAHPMVQNAIQYIVNTYDPARKSWPSTPRQVNDYPHAPWWHFDEEKWKNGVETNANPGAEILGYLYTWLPQLRPGDQEPGGFLEEVANAMLGYLESLPKEMEMHDLICFVKMAEQMPHGVLDRITRKLEESLNTVVTRNPKEWDSYCPQPLMYVAHPRSPFAGSMREAVEANLDYLIDKQGADGSWSPNWTWGENYPEAWEQAKRDWQGKLTVENLRKLQAFGRISQSVG